ncbi:recombinase family protein [Ursidibacter arcticus]
MALIGFARVSTVDQDLEEQINLLKQAGCIKIFQGKNSGTRDRNNKRLSELLAYIREGDIVVATKIDRISRSTRQIMQLIFELEDKKAYLKTLDGWIDTSNKNNIFSMSIIYTAAMFAELDRNMIISRTQEGKKAKIAAGDLSAIGGRPFKLSPDTRKKLMKDLEKGITINGAAAKYQISRATISRYKKMIKEQKQKGYQ